MFGHYTLMFQNDKYKATFFIDLWPDRENTDRELQVIMRFDIIKNEFDGFKQIPVGPIEKSLIDIFEKAYDVLQDLGAYHATMNSWSKHLEQL